MKGCGIYEKVGSQERFNQKDCTGFGDWDVFDYAHRAGAAHWRQQRYGKYFQQWHDHEYQRRGQQCHQLAVFQY